MSYLKPVYVIPAVIVLAIGLAAIYLLVLSPEKTAAPRIPGQPQTQSDSQPQATQNQPTANKASGEYVDYKDGVIAATKSEKWLFFHASWCPQCRAIESDINKMGAPDGVTIIKVDYDTSQKLKQQYGVTLQTTFVKVDDEGNLVKKYVAYDEPNLPAVIKGLS